MRVALFVPCFVDLLAPEVGLATARVLEHLGHEVVCPPDATCCGQPALNAGYVEDAACLARRFCEVFERVGAEAVVAPSGSCVAALRVQGPRHLGVEHALFDQLYELSEFLVGRLGVEDVGASFPGRVVWHDACHPLRELGVRDGPRRLLGSVRDLELLEADPSDECCGFGGTFSVKVPEVSTAMGRRKLRALEATGADYVASTETSCLLQVGGLAEREGSRLRTIHLAEILAATS